MECFSYDVRRKISAEKNARDDHDDWTIITWLGDATHTLYELGHAEMRPRKWKTSDFYSFKLKTSALNTLVRIEYSANLEQAICLCNGWWIFAGESLPAAKYPGDYFIPSFLTNRHLTYG